MKGNSRRNTYNLPYVKAIVIFLVAVICSTIIFFCGVDYATDQNVKALISKNVANQSSYFYSILEIQYRYLEGIAEHIGHSGELFSEENIELIGSVQNKTKLEHISIIDVNGTAYYDDGSTKDVSGRRYFKEGIAGSRTLSDPLQSRLDGETRVVLGVPILQDGDVIGILGGSYDVTELSRMLFGDIYRGEGISFIVSSDGTIISEDRMDSKDKEENNLFKIYKKTYGNTEEIEKLRQDILNGNDGYVCLGRGDAKRHIAYQTMGFNQWMVCYAVPDQAAKASYGFIKKYETIFAVVFSCYILSLFGTFVRISSKKEKELKSMVDMDPLTKLLNKQSTEEQITRYLTESYDKMSGIQVLLIVDIDYFKDINDNFGHTVGDEALRYIGNCIKDNFRTTDIVGRIGGDEFAVFVKDINSKEQAQRKLDELLQQIQNLMIPELGQEKMLTVSIGVSCYPEHGSSWMELYKHADMALYETKKSGRNGYTVYSKKV